MSVGWRLLLLAVLSRYRGWLPAPKGTVILAPLTLLWRGVVLPSLETVVAAAITVGIALFQPALMGPPRHAKASAP